MPGYAPLIRHTVEVSTLGAASDIISRIGLLFKKGTPQGELLDANEVIQEMMALVRSEASWYSIAIRGELANNLPKTMADRVQLQQVLMKHSLPPNLRAPAWD